MTHFPVVVFTKSGDPDEVERLLAPFDENDEPFAEGTRWDWWVIGGRWDGAMRGLTELDDKDGGFHFDEKFHTVHRNACQPADMAPDFVPWAFVTPDGAWEEKAQMGWWAVPWAFVTPDGAWEEKAQMGWWAATLTEEDEGWPQKWTEAKGAFAACQAVLVDCHV